MSAAHADLSAWSNFYVIMGSSSAALTGLMFVVVTLVAAERDPASARNYGEGFSTFSTPTVLHFCAALLVSAILAAPWGSFGTPAILLALLGLGGIVYIARVLHRTVKQTVYEPDAEDWAWYTCLPFAAYALIAVASFFLGGAAAQALFALAAATLLLVFIGIHNAWDVVTFLAFRRIQQTVDKPTGNDGTDRDRNER